MDGAIDQMCGDVSSQICAEVGLMEEAMEKKFDNAIRQMRADISDQIRAEVKVLRIEFDNQFRAEEGGLCVEIGGLHDEVGN